VAKIKLDDYNFYGELLHVFYAPEFEDQCDIEDKLNERRTIVAKKCEIYNKIGFGTIEYDVKASQTSFENKKLKPKKVISKMVDNPKLPPNWKTPQTTANSSYDKTIEEINDKLKRTAVMTCNYIQSVGNFKVLLFVFFFIIILIMIATGCDNN
jgi:hypothetical protein